MLSWIIIENVACQQDIHRKHQNTYKPNPVLLKSQAQNKGFYASSLFGKWSQKAEKKFQKSKTGKKQKLIWGYSFCYYYK